MTRKNLLRRLIQWAAPAIAATTISGASLAAPSTILAQEPAEPTVQPVVGKVLLDGEPVADAPVTIHRITSQTSGEVGTAVTDSAGTFTFLPEPAPGTAFTLYFATADHESVRFFGPLLRAEEGSQEEYILPIYETATALSEPIRIVSRDIVMIPQTDGSWEMNEIVGVLNPTSRALVGEGGMPPWSFGLPSGATDFQAGQGDVLPHELNWMDGRVMHLTPVTPGYREIFVRYRLPRDQESSTLEIQEPTDAFSLFVRQPAHLTSVSGLATTEMVDADGEQFLQYSAQDLQPGSLIQLEWNPPGPPVDPVVAAVGLTLILLAAAVWAALRNRSPLPA